MDSRSEMMRYKTSKYLPVMPLKSSVWRHVLDDVGKDGVYFLLLQMKKVSPPALNGPNTTIIVISSRLTVKFFAANSDQTSAHVM